MSNLDEKGKSIYDQLINLEIDDCGYVVKIECIVDNGDSWYQVTTNLNYKFNANLILNALSMMRLNDGFDDDVTDDVEPDAEDDDEAEVLQYPVGFPEGTTYAKYFSGPKKIHRAIPYVTDAVNNVATVSNPKSDQDSEQISITSYLSSKGN
jgi:hypothetical protein